MTFAANIFISFVQLGTLAVKITLSLRFLINRLEALPDFRIFFVWLAAFCMARTVRCAFSTSYDTKSCRWFLLRGRHKFIRRRQKIGNKS